jgi:hypothetical protein
LAKYLTENLPVPPFLQPVFARLLAALPAERRARFLRESGECLKRVAPESYLLFSHAAEARLL